MNFRNIWHVPGVAINTDLGIFEDTLKYTMENEFDEIIRLIRARWRSQMEDAIFDLTSLQRMDDDGGCQLWWYAPRAGDVSAGQSD